MEEFNKAGRHSSDRMIGHGSGVSPFCVIHQSLRSAAGCKFRVGQRPIQIVQLGCKAADGKKAIAGELCDLAGVKQEIVEKHLDHGMCVYAVCILDTGKYE